MLSMCQRCLFKAESGGRLYTIPDAECIACADGLQATCRRSPSPTIMRIDQGFQQPPFTIPPAWDSDEALRSLLRRQLPADVFEMVDTEMEGFQQRLARPIRDLANLANGPEGAPKLTQYDQWGRRIDHLHTSEGWRGLKGVAAAEGLVAIPMERKEGQYSRTFGFAKNYLMVPESGYSLCPISMTDGCARVLELMGTPTMKADIIPLLCSRDPNSAWTAGQWMTERTGGSDVSSTETTAQPLNSASNGNPQPGDPFLLDGFKWFSSAADGNVALALARTGPEGSGSAGLSLFLVNLRDESGGNNGILIHRLKEKWGTKAVPTAELSLNGTIGYLISIPGAGVRSIATVLNITRLHSTISAVGGLRRALVIAKGFAQVRRVGDSLLSQNEMQTGSIVHVEITHRALLHFAFGVIALLGRDEAFPSAEVSQNEQYRLRLLTPVVKAFCAARATSAMMDCMEALGGQGYMTENEIGRLIQDASVERIWEGTQNTLSLDVVRVIVKSKGLAIKAYVEWALSIVSSWSPSSRLDNTINVIRFGLRLLDATTRLFLSPTTPDPRIPRPLLDLLGHLSCALYLLEHCTWSKDAVGEHHQVDVEILRRWVASETFTSVMGRIEQLTGQDGNAGRIERQLEAEMMYGHMKLSSKL